MQFINDLNYLTLKGITMDRGYGEKGHGYGHLYSRYFSELNFKNVLKILEIGVSDCDSQIFWKLYFPYANYYGIDVRDFSHKEEDRIHIFRGNQAKREDLQKFINLYGSDFDIIIDDGGHLVSQQQISLGHLFPHLKAGGLYICEDLLTSNDSFSFPNLKWLKAYDQPEGHSSLKMFRQLEQYGITNSHYMSRNEEKYIDNNINWCQIEMGNISEIAFVKKKEEL